MMRGVKHYLLGSAGGALSMGAWRLLGADLTALGVAMLLVSLATAFISAWLDDAR